MPFETDALDDEDGESKNDERETTTENIDDIEIIRDNLDNRYRALMLMMSDATLDIHPKAREMGVLVAKVMAGQVDKGAFPLRKGKSVTEEFGMSDIFQNKQEGAWHYVYTSMTLPASSPSDEDDI